MTLSRFLPRGLAVLAFGFLSPRISAVPYTIYYDIFQGGYDGGAFPGTIDATIRVVDVNSDGLISPEDTIIGSLIFSRPLGNGRTYVRGFEVTSIFGSDLLSGAFTISALSHLGGPAILTNTGGVVVNFDFPYTGAFNVATTTQAPTITRRVDEAGDAMFALGAAILLLIAVNRRRALSNPAASRAEALDSRMKGPTANQLPPAPLGSV